MHASDAKITGRAMVQALACRHQAPCICGAAALELQYKSRYAHHLCQLFCHLHMHMESRNGDWSIGTTDLRCAFAGFSHGLRCCCISSDSAIRVISRSAVGSWSTAAVDWQRVATCFARYTMESAFRKDRELIVTLTRGYYGRPCTQRFACVGAIAIAATAVLLFLVLCVL